MACAVLFTTGPVHGMVVCISEDGNVAIESMHKAIFSEVAIPGMRMGEIPGTLTKLQHNHRGDCIDFPFGGNGSEIGLVSKNNVVKRAMTPACAAVAFVYRVVSNDVSSACSSGLSVPATRDARALRGTVLLI